MAKLAVAAVAGDDVDLNPFSTRKSSQFDLTQTVESLGFFLADSSGDISFVDAKGKISSRAKLASMVKQLSYCQKRAILIAACEDISLVAFRASPDGTLSDLGRVKLSGKLVSCDFIAPAVLVSATGDSSLKIWDLQKQEHHLIQASQNCQITDVNCNKNCQTIAAAAGEKGVLFWSFSRQSNGQVSFEQKSSSVSQTAELISWFSRSSLTPWLAVAADSGASFLREQKIQETSRAGLHVIQSGTGHKTVYKRYL